MQLLSSAEGENPKRELPEVEDAEPRHAVERKNIAKSMSAKSEIDKLKSVCVRLCMERTDSKWTLSSGNEKLPKREALNIEEENPSIAGLCEEEVEPVWAKSVTDTRSSKCARDLKERDDSKRTESRTKTKKPKQAELKIEKVSSNRAMHRSGKANPTKEQSAGNMKDSARKTPNWGNEKPY